MRNRPLRLCMCLRSWPAIFLLAALILASSAAPARAQLGQLISPGPLAKAHAALEGAGNCQKCHTPGKKLTADKCLVCHQPIADRMKARKGVHRSVTNECTSCHIEHAGVDGDLLHMDKVKYDHEKETGFALDGHHAATVTECAKCHKVHSFVTLSPACTSCHADVHKGRLGPNCANCHPSTQTFKDAKTRFDHSKTSFPLTGGHLKVACEKCHIAKDFKVAKFSLCADCHKNPHRRVLASDCRTCHTPDSWKTKKIDHSTTPFPLKGRHAEVACAKCHTQSPIRQVLAFDKCARCHADPHKGAFKQDCSGCHTEAVFARAKFDHAKNTNFPLVGKHEALACAKCHKNVAARPGQKTLTKSVDFRGLQTACVSCHTDIHKGQLGQLCETCHTANSFLLPNYVHPRFPEFFGGKHTGVPCASCHVIQPPGAPGVPRRTGVPVASWTFKPLATACASCHADVHLGQLGAACESCHKIDAASFAASTFSHTRSSFQLTGRHATVECRQCHKPETAAFPSGRGTAIRLKGLDTKCASCHKDQHAGQLGAVCETCHNPSTFKLPGYKHSKASAAIITGKHATLQCSACHKPEADGHGAGGGPTIRYKVGMQCLSCHADQHKGSLGKLCETCHSTDAWGIVSRAFHKSTRFPLEGQHLQVECAACHLNGITKGTPTRCYDCHWLRRQDDRYKTKLGNQCETCHRPVSWTNVRWDHGAMTGVVLSPVHRALGCVSCHKDNTFSSGDVQCFTCHATQFRSATSPNHQAAGFPTNCEVCHHSSDTSWTQATFTHSTFALVGVHATQQCAACHKNNIYQGTARDCVGCHKTDYDRTTNPNHAAAGYSTTCVQCHNNSSPSWTASSFNHASFFPLVGVHATQACAACHKNNVFAGTPSDCYGCHKTDYDRTTNPNHAAAGYPTTCVQCHSNSSSSFTASAFNHAAVFPLVGVHSTQPCAACHKNNVFPGTSTTCVGCHMANFNTTTNPSHAAAGFPTTCDTCHSNSSATWTASFNHSLFFVLAGRHLTASCTDCHKNNVYKGTPTTCYPCHQANYNGTTNPNHAAAMFPTTCDTCHKYTDSSWTQATFNHTWFPITSGRHSGNPCSACHNDPTNYAVFTCLTCHLKAQTDAQHQGRAGYRYDSAACYSCHPRGSAG